jgi:hypothetical protein
LPIDRHVLFKNSGFDKRGRWNCRHCIKLAQPAAAATFQRQVFCTLETCRLESQQILIFKAVLCVHFHKVSDVLGFFMKKMLLSVSF